MAGGDDEEKREGEEEEEEGVAKVKEKWLVVFLRKVTAIDPSTAAHYKVSFLFFLIE